MTQSPTNIPPAEAAPAPQRNAPLLSSQFMHQLDRLDVLSRKILSGKLQGERRGKKRGQSVEFADYRQYVSGDDLRFIDWNLFARLNKLFLRLFLEEEDLAVTVLIDTTRSMDFGTPNKLHYAKQVAAALGYIGLVNYNRVSLHTFSDDINDSLTELRGRRPVPQLLSFLEGIGPRHGNRAAAATGNLAQVCKHFAAMQRQKGIVILLSDFFDEGDIGEALKYLSGDRFDVYAIQLLAPEELDPARAQLAGDLNLRDVESLGQVEISISPAVIKRYQQTLAAFCDDVKHACLKREAAYLLSDTSASFDELVLRYLRERGLLG